MPEKIAVATYVSPKYPRLTFHVGDKSYRLKHGALHIFSKKEEKEIDEAIAGMAPRAQQTIRKVSRNIGVKLVEEHRANVRKQAVSGSMGTGHILKAASEVLQHQLATDMAQRNIDITPEAQEAAHKELGGMLVTSVVEPPKQTVPTSDIKDSDAEVSGPAPKVGIKLGVKTGD